MSTTHTHTGPDGKTRTRKSKKAVYTHAVYVRRYDNLEYKWIKRGMTRRCVVRPTADAGVRQEWDFEGYASSLELAQKRSEPMWAEKMIVPVEHN